MRRILFVFALVTPLLAACASAPSSDTQTVSAAAGREPVVARVWRGRVRNERAGEYERYLDEAGVKKFPAIPGNLGVQLLRRPLDDGTTEFVVVSYWPSFDAIKAYAGADIERARDLPRDREFLVEPERTVRHYVIKEWLPGNGAAPR
jgi:heme-degrading monooxygenase HmoA